MNKVLVFDMDGTIADFYGVENWLEHLNNFSTTPYKVAKPLVDMVLLNSLLEELKMEGWKIIVTTWLSKTGTKNFNNRTRYAKRKWLQEYGFPYDELHMIKYGIPKAKMTKQYSDGIQILIDDNAEVRKEWELNKNHFSIDANTDIIEKLAQLLN